MPFAYVARPLKGHTVLLYFSILACFKLFLSFAPSGQKSFIIHITDRNVPPQNQGLFSQKPCTTPRSMKMVAFLQPALWFKGVLIICYFGKMQKLQRSHARLFMNMFNLLAFSSKPVLCLSFTWDCSHLLV